MAFWTKNIELFSGGSLLFDLWPTKVLKNYIKLQDDQSEVAPKNKASAAFERYRNIVVNAQGKIEQI